ncbi:TonB-dependent receptor [Chryseolinea sp. H1M3-3]|uniref:TonB-dependent receptor n=1 Tax=Chryseolinea sp. H1M3-3 TaxID=3034144 RepID=UPI0023EA968C|nr:TonB-dependent receptor [Chryseolinea sp. H1M3-3]
MEKSLHGHSPFFLIFMKVAVVPIIAIMVFSGVTLAIDSRGQEILKKKISLSAENQELSLLLKRIEELTKIKFIYSPQVIPVHDRVTINAHNDELNKVLKTILTPYQVIFEAVETHIVLRKADVQQQDVGSISGKITDENNQPLPGVNVLEKGTTNGTVTDSEGKFTLTVVDQNAVIVISFIGYISEEIVVGERTVIDIQLIPDIQTLDDVVVIGYGQAKKGDLTGAVARVNSKIYKDQPMTQITDMLTGTVAGFNANQNTTAAGGSSLQIRGPKSLNASTEPMVVVDGAIFNGNISDINPSDIETIDILKDASSTAVFGARAAAGVLMITTKKGITGKPVINFSTTVGITEATNDLKPFEAEGYLDFRRDALISYKTGNPDYYFYNPNALPSGVTIDQWRSANPNAQADNTTEWLSRLRFFPIESDNYLAGNTVNWYDEVMRSGVRQNYDVSLSGGMEKFTYYWSVGYTNNQGIILGDEYSTLRSRLNLDVKVTDWLNVGLNSQLASNDESAVPADLYAMFVNSPYGSVYEPNGSVKWFPNDYAAVESPLINYAGQDKLRKTNSIFAAIYAKVQLPWGIEYKISYQPRLQSRKDYNFWPSTTVIGGGTHSKGYGTREDFSQYAWILDNLLHWNKDLGAHNFDVTLLYSGEKNRSWSSLMTNETFLPNENLGYNGLQFGAKPSLANNDQQITGDAVMGRLNYTLLDKYLLTVSVRRDGYSAFGKKNPRAVFPAAAIAWKLSDENFFSVDWISQLKMRLSWGVNGNREIGAYSALAQINSNLYYNGTNVQMGVYNNSLANYDLVWEKTESVNFGVDLGLFEDRIEVSAEYYDMTTTDLLMNRQLPVLTGFTNITTNLGELGNRGFELSVNTVNYHTPAFAWKSNFVFSFNRNKIKKLFGDYETVIIEGKEVTREVPDYTNEWFPGQALDRVWNYDVQGIWQENEATDAAVYLMQPGDFKAVDVDNNGVYEAIQDKQFIGYRQPRFRLGLRNEFTFLKNFSASVFIRADLGHVGAFDQALNPSSETFDKRNKMALPYWTSTNQNNEWARLNTNITSFGGGLMIYKERSFVRIQDVSLSYHLPAKITSNAHLNNVRIYGAIRNLYSFDKWPGWDPESGDMPMPRTYSLGVSFSL